MNVVVFGASGYVGQHVVKQLLKTIAKHQAGCTVIGVNRSGRPPSQTVLTDEQQGRVNWVAADAGNVSSWAQLLTPQTNAVISCIGALGLDQKELEFRNGDLNVGIVEQSAAAGVPRLVYVSAAHDPHSEPVLHFLPGYFKGKKKSEAAVNEHYPLAASGSGRAPGSAALILRPGFIYGDKPVPVPGAGVMKLPLGWVGRPMAWLFSSYPVNQLQRLPRLKQVFCPPVDVMDVGALAAAFALQGCSSSAGAAPAPAFPALDKAAIFNPEENTRQGVTVVDSNDIAALARTL